jgi:hypothetical protein
MSDGEQDRYERGIFRSAGLTRCLRKTRGFSEVELPQVPAEYA